MPLPPDRPLSDAPAERSASGPGARSAAARWRHVCALFEAALEQPPAHRDAFLRAATGTDAALLAEVHSLLEADRAAEPGAAEPSAGFLATPAGRVAPMVEAVVAQDASPVEDDGAADSDPAGDANPGFAGPRLPVSRGGALAPPSAPDPEHSGEPPAADSGDAGDAQPVTLRGTRVGPWRLVREIGRGGMGTVWLAERADGAFEQRVAVKRVRAAVFSEALRQRFVRERALLARLHHPNIAQLLDGGVTAEGLPYLVMEYVPGASLLDYCAARALTVDERVRVFLDVCEAVQYAHRHLVIHRDLKPSNIRVTPDGQAKLLDFGIGKLQHDDGEALTQTGIRPFTPQYAAPEQIRNRAITTATDVYGLGVLLFELLTGARPFTSATHSVHEVERAVLETAPPAPSAVLRRARADARTVRRVAGDLDAIVRKALAKAPERRYRSAEALARDLRRFLEAKPVQARRGAVGYRLRRNLYRHRWAVAGVSALIALLTAGILIVSSQAHRLVVERDKAVASAQFLSDLFGSGDPDLVAPTGVLGGPELSARALLERAVHRIDSELAGQPETRAAMQVAVGRAYQRLGLYDEGDALLRRALVTRQTLFGEEHPEVATTELALGALLADRSRYDEAERLHRRALHFFEARFSEDDPRTAEALFELGRTLTLRGDFRAAELLLRRALRLQEAPPTLAPRVLGHTLTGLAHVLYRQGLLPESEHYYREALDRYRPALGPLHVRTATALNELGVVIKNQGRYAEAEPYYRDALGAFAQIYGPKHPRRAYALANLGVLLKDRGIVETDPRHFREAEALLAEAHAMYRALYGDAHLRVGHSRAHLGMLALARGRSAEAAAAFRTALVLHDSAGIPAAHTARAYPLTGLGEALTALGRPDEALPPLREALAIREQATGSHWRIAEAQGALGEALLALGRVDEAAPLLTESYTRIEDGAGESERLRLAALRRLAALHEARGDRRAADQARAQLQTDAHP